MACSLELFRKRLTPTAWLQSHKPFAGADVLVSCMLFHLVAINYYDYDYYYYYYTAF